MKDESPGARRRRLIHTRAALLETRLGDCGWTTRTDSVAGTMSVRHPKRRTPVGTIDLVAWSIEMAAGCDRYSDGIARVMDNARETEARS